MDKKDIERLRTQEPFEALKEQGFCGDPKLIDQAFFAGWNGALESISNWLRVIWKWIGEKFDLFEGCKDCQQRAFRDRFKFED